MTYKMTLEKGNQTCLNNIDLIYERMSVKISKSYFSVSLNNFTLLIKSDKVCVLITNKRIERVLL